MSNAWDPFMIFRAPPHGVGQGSSSTCCSIHSLSSGALAASTPLLTAVLGSCPTVPVSLNCWGLLLQFGCTFTNGLSWALFMVPQLSFSVWLLWLWAFNCYWGWTFTNNVGLQWSSSTHLLCSPEPLPYLCRPSSSNTLLAQCRTHAIISGLYCLVCVPWCQSPSTPEAAGPSSE